MSEQLAGESADSAPELANRPDPKYFDLGHQGDFDRTQIAMLLAMTPTERLRHHEPWQEFVEEALRRAELRRTNHRRSGQEQS